MAQIHTSLPRGYDNTNPQLDWQKDYHRYSRDLFRSFTAPSEGSTTYASRSASSLRTCARAARMLDRQDKKGMMNLNLELHQRQSLRGNLDIVKPRDAKHKQQLLKESDYLERDRVLFQQ